MKNCQLKRRKHETEKQKEKRNAKKLKQNFEKSVVSKHKDICRYWI